MRVLPFMSVVPRVARTCTACVVRSATYTYHFYSSGCVAAPMPYCLPAEPWVLVDRRHDGSSMLQV
jgi:hypothetical protein